ncbi:hypothetical protein SGL43_04306 [Streptomyces globisporus]|uniref:Uncharacterized protein n=1 Tax=Streptomyces globisporus TaxID=1908 RepID=A0ABM9H0Y7_STRGL|nr:hypothetical protein SGL43_04306 [Streptomyces globisporus]
MRHLGGLAARPPMRYKLRVARRGFSFGHFFVSRSHPAAPGSPPG